MQVTQTALPGAYLVVPDLLADHRGAFFESMRADALQPYLGRPFLVHQLNYSVSRRNTLRGIHSVTVPPGQSKFVTCVRGAMRDIIVDLRVGSPAFGRHVVTELDPASGRALYIPDGVGHAFLALADDTCACYAVSPAYAPGTQIEVDPLDRELALPWGLTQPPVMSEKDRAAPSLSAALAAGTLSRWKGVPTADARGAAASSSQPAHRA